MKVIVTETEIKNAVLNQLKSQGITVEGRDVSISFSMGRKNKEGLAATVELIDPDLPVIADGTQDEEEEEGQPAAPAPAASTVGAVLAKPLAPKTFVSRAPVATPEANEAAAAPAVAAAPTPVAPAAASAAPVVAKKEEAPAVTGSPVAAEGSADAPFDVAEQQANDPAPEAEVPPAEAPAPAEKPKSLFAKTPA